MDWANATARRDGNRLSFVIWWSYIRHFMVVLKYITWLSTRQMHATSWCKINHAYIKWSFHTMTISKWLFWSAAVCPWWRHQMETFSALLAICARNSPVSGEFPAQRPVARSFNVLFDLCLIKHSPGWWFETPLWSLWRHRNAACTFTVMNTLQCVAPLLSQSGSFNVWNALKILWNAS